MGIFGLVEWASTAERVVPVLLEGALRSAVVLAVAGLGALVLRRASAAVRHWVWVLGFAGVVLLPVAAVSVPGWRVLPRGMTVEGPGTVTVITPPEEPVVAGGAETLEDTTAVPVPAPVRAAGLAPKAEEAVAPAPAAATPMEAETTKTAAASNTGATRPGHASVQPGWTFWIVVAWLAGSLVVVGHMVLGYVSLWMLQRRCGRLDGEEWAGMGRELRAELKVRRGVELLQSPLRAMPMTWGLWRARVLLPAEAAGWPEEQRRAVLLHELGHVRRWDCVTQLLAQLGCAMYWFNPLVWMGWRRMQVERERACDDLVLSTGARASVYARHLLQSASAMPVMRFVGSAAAMARASTLEERMRAILETGRNRRGMSVRMAVAMLVLMVAGLVPVAALRGQAGAVRGGATEVPAPPGYAAAATGGSAGATTRPVATAPGRSGGRGSFGATAGRGAGMTAVPPVLGEGPTCTLDATIYDVRMPVDKIGQLDVEAMSKAAGSAAGFEKALGDLGAMVPLYRVDQSVRLQGDMITIGTQTPYVTNSQMTARGQTINSVAYTQMGAVFSVAGKAGAAGKIELDLGIQVSAMSDGGTPISENVKAPMFRTAMMTHKGQVEAQKPFVVVSVDAASVDGNGKAVAYIARVTLGKAEE